MNRGGTSGEASSKKHFALYVRLWLASCSTTSIGGSAAKSFGQAATILKRYYVKCGAAHTVY